MSQVRPETQQLKGLWCHSLKEPALCKLLREYHALLLNLHGPKSGTLLLRHSGGLDSFINSSSDLTKKLQPFHPCLKFINALIEAQVSAYGSHGLYCGLLCTALLRELLLVTEEVPQAVVREVADAIASIIIEHCSTPTSLLDLSNLHQMLSYLGSCLDSKALGLTAAESAHVKATVLQAFLLSVSDTSNIGQFGDITVTLAPGRPPSEATAFQGLLYRHNRFQELSMSRIIDTLETGRASWNLNTAREKCHQSQTVEADDFSSEDFLSSKRILQSKMISRYSHNSFLQLPDTSIRILLFNVMLEFTNSKTEIIKYAGNVPSSFVFDTEVSRKLYRFIEQEQIQVLACQKVVSEGITFELERQGVLVLERLGTSLTASLEKLSCCLPLSDLSILDAGPQPCSGTGHSECNCPLSGIVGKIDSLKRLHLPSGVYLLLQNSMLQLPVVTLLLPALSSPVAENLKVVVQEALRSVSQAALSPGVVCSRCKAASLAAVLRQQDIRSQLQCATAASAAQVALVIDAFWRTLVGLSAHCGSPGDPLVTPVLPLPLWGVGALPQQERTSPQRAATPDAANCSATSGLSTSATHASCTAAGCLVESQTAVFSAISSALETALQLLQVDYCIFDR